MSGERSRPWARRLRPRARVLRSRWGARLVHGVALLQVALLGGEEVEAAPPPKPARLPDVDRPPLLGVGPQLSEAQLEAAAARVRDPAVRRALSRVLYDGRPLAAPELKDVERALSGALPAKLRALIDAELRARAAGRAAPPVNDDALIAALDELEGRGLFDDWIVAFLWGHLEHTPAPRDWKGRAARRALLKRLHHHARVTVAQTRARAELRDVEFVPWRSKAAPPPGWRERRRDAMVSAVLARHLSRADAGTWSRSVIIELTVAPGSAPLTVIRDGVSSSAAPGERARVGRLDMIETGEAAVTIEHPDLGALTIPAGQQLTSWQLPTLLGTNAQKNSQKNSQKTAPRAAVDVLIRRALAGDEAAALTLERPLLVTHAAVRAAVRERPRDPGSARLRMILALFDDAVVRARDEDPYAPRIKPTP